MNIEEVDLTFIETLDDVLDFKQWLGERREWLAFDVETTGLHPLKDKIRLCQFGDTRRGFCFAWQDYRGIAADVFDSYRGNMVAHNLSFDRTMLKVDGIEVPRRWAHDTMIMSHLHNSASRNSLKVNAARLIDPRAKHGEDKLKTAFARGKWNWATIPLKHRSYWLYSGLDTCLTAGVAEALWPKIDRYRDAYEREVAAIHVLSDAIVRGVRIDLDYVERKLAEVEARIEELRPQIPLKKAGSDDELRRYIKANGGVLPKLTDKGNESVDGEVLALNEERIPACRLIREYRDAEKVCSSYLRKFLALNVDGVLHPWINVIGARRTGRMSITDPSMQNMHRGRIIRDAIVPREGHSLVLVDYAQMEMRVMSHYANETAMIKAFNDGEDIHNFVASNIYGEDFTKPQRYTAKNSGFAKIYCAGVPQFSATAGITEAEGKAFLDKFDLMFPAIEGFVRQVIRAVRDRGKEVNGLGWVHTHAGKRLFVDDDRDYSGVNYIIQGSCAEVLKRSLIHMDAVGLTEYFRLPVHDEVMSEVPTEWAEDVQREIEEIMRCDDLFCVPLTTDGDVAHERWGDKYADEVFKGEWSWN